VALFVGVALVCLPPDRYGDVPVGTAEVALRYGAAALSGAAGLAELLWWLYRRRPTAP